MPATSLVDRDLHAAEQALARLVRHVETRDPAAGRRLGTDAANLVAAAREAERSTR